MEVIVSAAVLVVVVLGVLAGLDSVSRTAAGNQGRTVAAALAEKDLERLRAYKTSDLNRLDVIEIETKTVTVAGAEWKVTSTAQWVTDADGEDISCARRDERGSYLKISSSVVPAKQPDARPVSLSSIVAPQPGKGTLSALVKNAGGQAVEGMPVQAIGPSGATRPTNAAGCAVFDESEAGSYKLKLDYTGWGDPDGNQAIEKTGTVSAGNLTTVEFLYDRLGRFPVNVVTRRPGTVTDVADRSAGAIAGHTGVSTGFRAMTSASGATGFNFTGMFPFQTPYEVYSGTCTANNPAPLVTTSDYFTTHPLAVAKVDPGAVGPTRVVLEPALDVTVNYNGSPRSGAIVYAIPRSTGCDQSRVRLGQTGSNGRIPADTEWGPGMPFGTYDVCVQYTRTVSGSTRTARMRWDGVANIDPAGWARTANFVTSDNQGACPSS